MYIFFISFSFSGFLCLFGHTWVPMCDLYVCGNVHMCETLPCQKVNGSVSHQPLSCPAQHHWLISPTFTMASLLSRKASSSITLSLPHNSIHDKESGFYMQYLCRCDLLNYQLRYTHPNYEDTSFRLYQLLDANTYSKYMPAVPQCFPACEFGPPSTKFQNSFTCLRIKHFLSNINVSIFLTFNF